MVSSIQSPEVINFGKFKGTPLNELKPSYVHWLLKLENLNSDLREKLEAIDAEREREFQRRKAAAIMFSKPCFQRDRYSANQRIAYNNVKYNKGL